MIEQEKIFALLSKLSSTERQEGSAIECAYEALQDTINRQLTDLIERSSYPRKSQLKAGLDEAMETARLFIRYPFLYGRTIVGVVGGTEQERAQMMLRLRRDSGYAALPQPKQPCVIYNDEVPNRIWAINRADNAIQLSGDEYELAMKLDSDQQHVRISMSDVLKSYAISASLKYPLVNYVLFSRHLTQQMAEYGQLTKLCNAFFIFFDKKKDKRNKLSSMSAGNVPIFLVAPDGDEAASVAVEQLRTSNPLRTVRQISQEMLEEVLKTYDQGRRNMLADSLLAVLLQLRVHQSVAIATHDRNVQSLARSTVFADEEREVIERLRREESGKRDRERGVQKELETIILTTLKQVRTLEDTFKAGLPANILEAVSKADTGYAAGYSDLAGRIILLALQCGDLPLAHQYLRSLQGVEADLADIYRLYCCEAAGKALPEDALLVLRKQRVAGLVAQHASVHFADQLGFTPEERDKIAHMLPDKNADELYYSACHLKRQGQADAAKTCFENAFEAGSVQAGEELVAYYEQDNDSRHMRLLADSLIPKAAYLYGRSRIDARRYAQGNTYLRIAISMHYSPAIQYYADMLYEKAGKDEAKVRIAIALYRFLCENGGDDEIAAAKLGVLYYRQKAYVKAKPYLERGKSFPEANYCLGRMYLYGESVAKDLRLAKKHLHQAESGGYEKASKELEKLKKIQEKKKAQKSSKRYNRSKNYSTSRTTVSSSDDEGCFITTATCLSEGKADDCDELTLFRRYRDEVLLTSPHGQALVKEYYRIAPTIVEKLSSSSDSQDIYHSLYNRYILPGYQLLCRGEGDAAKQLYEEGVRMLAEKYGLTIQEN